MNRRQFLKASAAVAGSIAAAGVPANYYLNDRSMARPPIKEGHLLFDAHSHIPNCGHYSIGQIAKHLSTQATAISAVAGYRRIMSYEELIYSRAYFKEIEPGKIAEVNYKGNTGIIIKAQEVHSDQHHYQNIGAKYVSEITNPFNAIDQIHAEGGLAIANHFFIVRGGVLPITASRKHNEFLEKLIIKCDESEVFNASAVNTHIGINYEPNNTNSLPFLESLKEKYPALKHKGIAVSDSHHELEASGMAGIYMPREAFKDFNTFKECMLSGNFERCTQVPHSTHDGVISRKTALKGIAWNVVESIF